MRALGLKLSCQPTRSAFVKSHREERERAGKQAHRGKCQQRDAEEVKEATHSAVAFVSTDRHCVCAPGISVRVIVHLLLM